MPSRPFACRIASWIVVHQPSGGVSAGSGLPKRYRSKGLKELAAAMVIFGSLAAARSLASPAEGPRAEQTAASRTRLRCDLDEALAKMSDAIDSRRTLAVDFGRHLDLQAQEADNDAGARLVLAVAYAKLGTLQGNPYRANLGDSAGALASYGKALDLATAIVTANPNDAAAKRVIVLADEGTGDVLAAGGRREESLASYQRGIEIARPLAAANPDNSADHLRLWLLCERVGDAQFAGRQYPIAAASYQDGVRAAERFAALEANSARTQQGLAASHAALATALLAGHQDDASSAEYRRGLEIADRLAEGNPVLAQTGVMSSPIMSNDLYAQLDQLPGDSQKWKLRRRTLAAIDRLTRIGLDDDTLQRDLAAMRRFASPSAEANHTAHVFKRFVRQPIPGENGG